MYSIALLQVCDVRTPRSKCYYILLLFTVPTTSTQGSTSHTGIHTLVAASTSSIGIAPTLDELLARLGSIFQCGPNDIPRLCC